MYGTTTSETSEQAQPAPTLEWHLVDDEQTGLWCKECGLPSVSIATFALVDVDDLRVLSRQRIIECDNIAHPGIARHVAYL